ncbi:hypothetical protein HFO69_02875 [Rhizobium laguerreae]|nr:hypothetical protein [Rhizobium laguerreae]MBY3096666.1 hypothetical protein [Rhizobium laguerreae]
MPRQLSGIRAPDKLIEVSADTTQLAKRSNEHDGIGLVEPADGHTDADRCATEEIGQ